MSKKNGTHAIVAEAEVVIPTEQPVEIVAETPKTETPAVVAKPVRTPTFERSYILKNVPSLSPKGKQRTIVLEILKNANGQPMLVTDIAAKAEVLGLQASAGVKASTAWHLHQMCLLGIAQLVNPMTTTEAPAAEAPTTEAPTTEAPAAEVEVTA